MKGRLSRARDKLKERLTRRGVTLPSVFVADLGRGLPTLVPPALLQSTTLAATRLATGQTLAAGIISAQSLRLMEGVIGTMFTTPLKIVATALASACLIAVPGVMAYQSATRPARPELPAPVVPEQTVIKTETSKPFEVPRPTNPALASRKSAEIAILALEALDVSRSEGNAIDPALESEWSRRLFAAISAPVFPPAEREVLLQLHLRRRERLHDQFLKAREKGGSRLGDLEEAFQLNETYRMLLRAETPPRLAENPFPAGGGGALGGASLPRILIDNPADQKQNEAIRAKLEERMTMNFPTDTTLEDLKRYLQQQTVDEKLGLPKGIPVYFDPQGLQDADKTMASTIAIELEGIPLRTILKLVLRQVGLTYSIEGAYC